MVRRVTPSQIRSMLRQAESKQRQTVNNHNRQVRDHNAKVKRAADAYNRDIREYNAKRRRAIEAVNRDIRTYNSRVRTYRARLQEVRSVLVRQQPVVGHFYSIHQSAIELSAAYDLLDRSHADPYLADLGEKEAVNSLTVVKDLIEGTEGDVYSGDAITDSKITTELSGISQELSVRWHGALYALNPRNPEAARHFCSSSREIVAGVLNIVAPDAEVFDHDPNCQVTERGNPTRRSRIRFSLERLDKANDDLENFIDVNVRDLNTLFRELNAGAHGPSDKFTLQQLAAIKIRVEDAIGFVSELMP